MTELTEAQKTLAEVVLAHELAEYSWGVDGCECGHRDTANHHIHVALEIDKALGGLTREVHPCNCGIGDRLDPVVHSCLIGRLDRWVSDWTVAE